MSSGQKVPRARIEPIAQRLVGTLDSGCLRLEVAGSLRRKRADVGDIELVAIARVDRDLVQPEQRNLFGEVVRPAVYDTVDYLDSALQDLLDQGWMRREPPASNLKPAWGEKYRKFWIWLNDEFGWFQVDLFITTPEQWGAIFAIRTGPRHFSKALVTWVRFRTPYLQDKGYLTDKETGQPIATPEERDYFKAVGLLWIPPSLRDRSDAMSICQGKVKV